MSPPKLQPSWLARRRPVQLRFLDRAQSFVLHVACFDNDPDRPALFINVTNLSLEHDVEITHVWVESDPRNYALPQGRPLPTRLRPSESWETWVYLGELTMASAHDPYRMARIQLSTGEVLSSTENVDVPEVGYVPGGKPA